MSSIQLLSELESQLAVAQIVDEKLVFRTQSGNVYTVEIGHSLINSSEGEIGAKVTLENSTPTHVGIVQGEKIDDVRIQAQKMIIAHAANLSPIAAPHIAAQTKASA